MKLYFYIDKGVAIISQKPFISLAHMYSKGLGVEPDKTKAKELFGVACDKGFQKGCKARDILIRNGL